MEDGITLGIVMHGASTPAEIETRLDIYQQIRRNRASVTQILSNVGQDQVDLIRDELLKYITEDEIPRTFLISTTTPLLYRLLMMGKCTGGPKEVHEYLYGFDIVRTTVAAMKQHDSTFELPTDFFQGEVTGVPEKETSNGVNGH